LKTEEEKIKNKRVLWNTNDIKPKIKYYIQKKKLNEFLKTKDEN